jgi:hypothetical protein
VILAVVNFSFFKGMNWNPVGIMLATLRSPIRVFPMNCKEDSKPPTEGSLALQLERGVLTTRLQSVNSEERTYCRGSKRIENTPLPLVVALETTFPAPHCSCTRASRSKHNKILYEEMKSILAETNMDGKC